MDVVPFAIGLAMLVGASWSDLQIRRVRDRYWLPFLVTAACLAGQAGLTHSWSWMGAGFALGTCALLYALWWLGLFGGADAKGLMVLALMSPTVPDLFDGRTTLAIDALLNGALLVVLLPPVFVFWNLIRRDVRLPVMFLGVRMNRMQARARHVWPMERPDGSLVVMHKPGQEIDWLGLPARIWVTPKVPFMVPLTLGLALAWKGNLVLIGLGL